jgi:hypothetical protein
VRNENSGLLDFDLDLFLFGLFRFWENDFQQSILIRGAYFIMFDLFGKVYGPGKVSITSLDEMIVFFLLLFLLDNFYEYHSP